MRRCTGGEGVGERTPGIGHGTGGRHGNFVGRPAPIVPVMKREDRVLMGGTGTVNRSHTEAVSGASGCHMRPRCYDRTCATMMICRRASGLKGMRAAWFHSPPQSTWQFSNAGEGELQQIYIAVLFLLSPTRITGCFRLFLKTSKSILNAFLWHCSL